MFNIVKTFNKNIFRGYDIRGISGKDLSADLYYTLGRAYAVFLSQRRIKLATVGRDNRLTGGEYAGAFVTGLNDGGIDTIDLGISLSQIVYFSCYEFKTKGSAMVTASHNPKEFNGLKLGVGYSDTMLTEEIEQLKQIIMKGEYSAGSGSNKTVDIFDTYKKEILKYFDFHKRYKVVVDCCNTASGKFYPSIFRDAGFTVIEQNCELDGHFPSGVPDPTELRVLERLSKGVKESGADIGFAYDTDGDRMSVVDENGKVLWMDTIVAIFAKDILESIPNAPIVYNALCSKQVTETIEKENGRSIIWKTGHSFIKSKIKETRAPFGGELSGHIFFTDNFFGHDDGAYASLRLLDYLQRKNIPLSTAVNDLPQYISSPEIKLGLSDEIKFDLIDNEINGAFRVCWPDAKFIEIDGIRMEQDDCMAIVRASHNGPYITIKFEAKTQDKFQAIKKSIYTILKKHRQIDWRSGVNTHVFSEFE